MRVILLCGGESAERAVSLRSGARVFDALAARGHSVEMLDFSKKVANGAFFARCRAADAVFLALHGGAGEDGRVQAMLEGEGIYHYTGSGPAASALAMQKSRAKACVASAGIPVAKGGTLLDGKLPDGVSFPVILKPECGGSSVGLQVLEDAEKLANLTPCEGILCEEYLPGREFSVGILGERVLPAVEIRPRGGLYDYAHKYTKGITEELCPAPLSPERTASLAQMAHRAFHALGLCDVARIDFKENAAGVPCFLEANTLPGMTETSLLPQAALAVGISFPQLCEQLLQLACAKHT